jgi:preprotein translocase SecE subunit
MASETKTKEEQAMAAEREDESSSAAESVAPVNYAGPAVKAPVKPGFFAIYKKGQGYWTRMGTAVGAGLLGLLLVGQMYYRVPAFMRGDAHRASKIALLVAGVFGLVYALFAWRLMNKPSNVDFLIATDSEMKKVNWTSRRELIGSTKVVIGFMFSIAITLFLLDLFFNTVFYYLHILHDPWWKTLLGSGSGH